MIDDSFVLIASRIELDKDKIERDGVYDYDALIRRIDYIFETFGSIVLEHGHLYGNRKGMSYKEADISQTGAMIYLGKCKWFIENVKKWEMAYGYAQGEDRLWGNTLESYNEVLKGKERYVE